MILEEKLYYLANKQSAYLFQIKKEKDKITKKLNKNVFLSEKYNEELQDTADKYWGKYSFLALLASEMVEKNLDYVYTNISKNILDVINKIIVMNVHVDKRIEVLPRLFITKRNRINICYGTVKKEELSEIEKYEDILNIFFTEAYSDIKKVEYHMIEMNDNKIQYELYFEKVIGGKIKQIPYRLESDGTKRVLSHFNSLIGAMVGETVIIDEIDNGIHDVLMKNIIMSIKDEITGQLVITTHNTLLLEVLPKEYIYILSTDYNGNRTLTSIKDYEFKVQKNNNARDLYFKGAFGGVPLSDYINFDEIKDALEEKDSNLRKDKIK